MAVAVVLLLAAGGSSVLGQEEELPPGVSVLPVLSEFVDAPFPELALEDEAQADVLLRVVIDADGLVAEAQATEVIFYFFDENDEIYEETFEPEYDPYGFVDAAEVAVRAFRFEPARDEAGEPVAVELIWRYGFYFTEEETVLEAGPDEVVLRGECLERGSLIPLNGVEVTVGNEAEEHTVSTDVDGVFELSGLAPGSWTVSAAPENHEPLEAVEEIVEGQRTEVTYLIERVIETEYAYEVRAEAVRREVSRQTLTVMEIERVPGNSGDVIKVIQNLPGIARSPFNGGLVVIRGSAPEDSRIYVDGVFVPLIFHFGGFTSVLPSDVLDEIEYIPGAFSVEYGRATGGVINARTRAPQTDGYHGVVDIDVFDASVFAEGPITEDWSFFAGARRSYIDALLPVVIPEDAGLNLTVAPRYWDYQARVQWEPDPDNSASAFVFGSDDALSLLLDESSDPSVKGNIETDTEFHRLVLRWKSIPTARISNDLQLSVGLQNLTFLLGDDLRFVLETWPFNLRDRLDLQLSESFALRLGVDFDWVTYDLSIRSPRPPKEGEFPSLLGVYDTITLEQNNFWLLEPAIWAEAEWDIVEGLTLVSGLRGEFYSEPVNGAVDGRLTVRYDINSMWTVKAAAGTFHEPPQPDESSAEFGNPDLGLEWAAHYVAGTVYRPTDFLEIDVQLFYKDLFDLVSSSDALVERDGATVPEVYDNNGRGRVYGAEVLVRHQLANNFFGWISYTLSRSERRDNPSDPYRLFSYDQTHILSVIGSYDFGRGWSAGARFRFVTGNPDTPVIGSVYDADIDGYVRMAGAPLSERLEPFHQLDVRVDKSFDFERWDLDLYIDVQNVYNRGNPEGVQYNFDFSQRALFTGLPIIPSFGVRGSF